MTINSGATLQAGSVWGLGLATNAAVAQINVNGGTLSFGETNNTEGGTVARNITMTGGTINAYGAAASSPTAAFDWYTGGPIDQTTNNGYGVAISLGLTNNPVLATLASSTVSTVSDGINLRLGTTNNFLIISNAVGTTANGVDLLISGSLQTDSNAVDDAFASVEKTGAGVTELSGSNSYNGNTIINQGTIIIGNNYALSTNAVILNGGNLGTLTNATFSVANAIVLSNNATLSNGLSSSLTLSGTISGSGNLTQLGSGTTILTGVNTYTGTTTISGGTLQVGNGGTTGNLGSGNVTNNASLIVNLSTNISFSQTISGTGSLTQSGTGTTTLTANNTYTGSTTVSSGALSLGTTGKLSGTTNVVVNGGTLLLGASNSINSSANLTLGGGTLSMGAGSTRDPNQTFGTLTLTANSVIDFANLSGTSVLTFGSITGLSSYSLSIYDWNGTTYWGNTSTIGGTNQTTQLIDLSGLTQSQLNNISFYSGFGTGFLGTGIFSGSQIIPVPEPSVIISAVLLLIWILFPTQLGSRYFGSMRGVLKKALFP